MRAGRGLLERDAVIDSVARLVDGLSEGRGDALFVSGEAGLGKTSVLKWARQRAADAGLNVGVGRAHPMETDLPFGLVAQALGGAGAGDLVSVRRGNPAAGDDRATRFYAVLQWLEARARDGRPVLFLLDDLHWADPDSLALVVFVCRRVSPSMPLALIGTMRPWPTAAAEAVLGLAHEGRANVQRLAPLSPDAASALLANRLGGPVPDDVGRRAYDQCAGNPLLLEQVARTVTSGTKLPDTNGLLLGRFADLPSPGMRCAEAAAVLGTRFLPALAAELAGLTDDDTVVALDALGRSGLIEQGSGGEADFVHPLFRHALYEDMPGPLRTRLHARAFDLLTRRGLEAQAAEHAVQANLLGDARAVEVLARAGTAARRAGALDTAVRRFDAAVTLAGDLAGDLVSDELLLARAEALLTGGNPARAVAAYRELLRTRTGLAADRKAQAQWKLGRALVLTGAHDKAVSAFDTAVRLAQADDRETAVAVLLDLSFSTWLSVGPGRAVTAASRATRLAETADDNARACADAAWGMVALQTGDPAGLPATEAAARTARSGRASGMGLAAALHPLANYGFCMVLLERLTEADQAFSEILAMAEKAGAVEDLTLISNVHAWVLTRMGQLDAALGVVDRAISLADLVPVTEAYSWMARSYIQLFRGDLADSVRWYDRAEPAALERGQWNSLLYLCDIRGMRALRSGSAAEACECYARLEDILQKTGIGEPCLPPWARHGIAAYLAAGQVSDAERVIGWLDSCSARLPCRYPRIAALTGRARMAELAGDKTAADELHLAALALHDEVALPIEHAETLLGYGEFLRRSGTPGRARPVLARAAEVAEAANAHWLAGLAHAELRVAGGRRRQRARGLTAQERRVATLVTTGASNPEIARQLGVSVRTIETHLEHVYAKLAIRSRHELMAMVSSQLNIGVFPDAPDPDEI